MGLCSPMSLFDEKQSYTEELISPSIRAFSSSETKIQILMYLAED